MPARPHKPKSAERADVIFVIVPDTPHVEEVLFNETGVAARRLSAGKTVVDMSSISPIGNQGVSQRGSSELGCDYVDAPVSGGEVGAKGRHADDHVRRTRRRHSNG